MQFLNRPLNHVLQIDFRSWQHSRLIKSSCCIILGRHWTFPSDVNHIPAIYGSLQTPTHPDMDNDIGIKCGAGTHPNNIISFKFKIRSKFAVLWLKMCSTSCNEILHISQQCYCCDVCKISLWSAAYVMNKRMTKFHWISNSMKISLLGWASQLPFICFQGPFSISVFEIS